MDFPLLRPVALLLGWSLVMLVWMYVTRLPAMSRAGIDLKNLVGGSGKDLDKILPRDVQWVSHNYNHLMEQPTLFYAGCLTLSLYRWDDPATIAFAWAYAILRIVHSLIQSLSNRIRYRFAIFLLASVALSGLIVHAVFAAFGS